MLFGHWHALTRVKINVLALFHLPWWIVKNIIPNFRPRSTWSFKRSFMVDFVRFVAAKIFAHGLSDGGTHEELKLGKGVLGTYVDPVPRLVQGALAKWAENANVTSMQIPGYWLHRRGIDVAMGEAPSSGNEKVFYFMHGGAYVSFSAHPSSAVTTIPKQLLKHCPAVTRAFCIEYRLCRGDGTVSSSDVSNPGPFPAALLDALAGYVYLISKVGFKPKDVVFVGDSAGGNLALALTRYLVENHTGIEDLPPPPGSLLLLSPWCDLSDSFSYPGSSYETNAYTDIVVLPHKIAAHSIASDLFVSAKQLCDEPDFYLCNPYVSPASRLLETNDFGHPGWPRTFVNGGGAEVLIDQIRELVLRMRKDMGDGRVEYLEAPEAIHDYLSHQICEPEKAQLLHAIFKWVSETPSSSSVASEVNTSH